ncbi:MAG: hypothetical protein IT381_04820 [Deltaproteobacteria bacterium]|nr:hypothetical protein [Deltaproteobacteria bacterium]
MTEFDPNMPDPLDIPLHNFKLVAGTGALLELHLRLFAGAHEELESFAHAYLLENVEAGIVKVFGDRLSEEEKNLLKDCRQLRNKVLHCDFRAVKKKLGTMGVAVASGGVTKMNLHTGESKLVSDSSIEDGGVFGWLLEAQTSGLLSEALNVFNKSVTLIRRLAHDVAYAKVSEA